MNISLRNLWRSVTAVGISLVMVALLMGAGQKNVQAQGSLYKKVNGVGGNLSSVGSDTLNNVMTLWAENFRRFYPGVNVQVEGKGSGTAPPALAAGTSQLGPIQPVSECNEAVASFSNYSQEKNCHNIVTMPKRKVAG